MYQKLFRVQTIVPAVLVVWATQAIAAVTPVSTSAMTARDTLRQIELCAEAGSADAQWLALAGANPDASWKEHSYRLTEIRHQINSMGRLVSTLQGERDSLTQWERDAVDRVLPLLQDAAANTRSAIEFLNQNQSRTWMAPYHESTEKVWHDSEKIAASVHDYLRYSKLRDEEGRLVQHLRS